MKKILMIVGSLRGRSFNGQLARAAAPLLGDDVRVKVLDYASVPFMNQDREFPAPESVARVRTLVQAADGIWIFTPEYNYSYPGVLKNLLDWLSRPLRADDRQTAIAGKKVTISSVAGSSKGTGARRKLEELCAAMGIDLMREPQVGIALDREAFTSDELKLTEEDLAALRAQAEAFLKYLDE